MSLQRGITWLGGDDSLSEINRIFNISSLIGALFCLLSGVECWMASLNPILIAGNFFYMFVLIIAYHFSRFWGKFAVSRILSIITLLVVYLPVLWFFNGGHRSAIPYFIPLFISFLTICLTGRRNTKGDKIVFGFIIAIYCLEVIGLILVDFLHPECVYQYTDPVIQMVDITTGSLFAILGNFMLILAFVNLYYRQLEKTEQQAIRDSMTGLYNHLFIVSRLEEELERSARYHTPLSIIILDVDHFKKINDTCGHLMGDIVLKKISAVIKAQCRAMDKIGRYGGDEFLIILPETKQENAAILAKRLMENVLGLTFDQPVTVTISQGVAQYQEGDTTTMLIDRADDNLYAAKESGRNQFVC